MKEKNLDLVLRAEETREKNRTIPNIVKFQLNEIEQHFNENLRYIQSQFDIADELLENAREIEAENIWSSQIVFLESAFDFYLHKLTKFAFRTGFTENCRCSIL